MLRSYLSLYMFYLLITYIIFILYYNLFNIDDELRKIFKKNYYFTNNLW